MVDPTTQASSGGQGVHLVLYDGVCGLCNRLLQFLLAVDHRAVVVFASLQSATGRAIVERAGGHPDDLNSVLRLSELPNAQSSGHRKERGGAVCRRRTRVAMEADGPDAGLTVGMA